MNLSALKHRQFQVYLSGKTFALNSVWMLRMTFAWLAWDTTGSASFVGLIAFLSFVPTLIVGPLFGVLIDRVRVQYAAIVTQSSLLALTVALYFMFTSGNLNSTMLVVLATLSGLITSAHNPVRMSLAPRLVDKDSISSVVTIVAISFNLARLTGPAIGGWLIAQWGIANCLIVQTLGYIPFIFALSLLRPRAKSNPLDTPEPFVSALKTGIRYTLADPKIRQAMIVTGLVAFVIRGTLEIMPVIADGVFEKGAVGLGILTSVAGFGALMAGVLRAVAKLPITESLPRKSLAIALIGMALIPVLGHSTSWGLTIILVAWSGFTATSTAITTQTAIQTGLSDELRGRVMSLWTMTSMGMAAVGVFLLGLLTDRLGLPVTLSIAGGLGLVALIWVVRKEW